MDRTSGVVDVHLAKFSLHFLATPRFFHPMGGIKHIFCYIVINLDLFVIQLPWFSIIPSFTGAEVYTKDPAKIVQKLCWRNRCTDFPAGNEAMTSTVPSGRTLTHHDGTIELVAGN